MYNNCIEHQYLESNSTPQEEAQWNKDGAIDVDNKDLAKFDNDKETEKHLFDNVNFNMSSEDKDKTKKPRAS